MIRPRTITALSIAVISIVWQAACGGDSPTEPTVASVALSTDAVEVVQGGEVQLEATLTDDGGSVVTGVAPQWSSDAPSIASVDGSGVVRGESVGTTMVRATYGDASAAAEVSVLPPPGIGVSPTEVAFSGGVGSAPPAPRTLDITNSGAGALEGLSVEVSYPSDPTGWLTAELGGTSAPTTITLTVVSQGLQAGVHAASVSIASTSPGAEAVEVPVTLTLNAVGVSEAVPQGHPDVSADALVASYDMSTLTTDGLLRDFSGNDLHGTIAGTTPVDGVRGGARSFSGDPADRIALPSATQLDLDGPLTVASWFRIDTSQHQHVIACDDKFVLWLRESDAVRLANTRSDYVESVDGLSSGEFHSVVGIFRGTAGDPIDTNNLEIWIDGMLVDRFVGSAVEPPVWRDGVLYPTDACYIGFESHQGRPDHENLGFHGVIDEVLVFGRALTPEEVALLAQTIP